MATQQKRGPMATQQKRGPLATREKIVGARWATTALVILTALNFVNYIDRSVLFAVQPLVQREFPGSDARFGLLTTAFFFCYMATAPLTGWLADRYSRRWIMCVGASSGRPAIQSAAPSP